MKMIIIRTKETSLQTIGQGFVFDESGQTLCTFNTLELPFKNNSNQISNIPTGNYIVRKRKSLRFGSHFQIMDVIDRDLILIHVGNYYNQTKGCVLVGSGLHYINNDNELDVLQSLKTMQILLTILPLNFDLKIIEI